MLVVGLCVLIFISIVARFLVTSPEAMGLKPDGSNPETPTAEPRPNAGNSSTAQLDGMSLRQAAGTSSFWVILAAFTVAMLSLTVPFVHIVGHAHDIGITGLRAAMAVSTIGLFSLVGSVSLGSLSDRLGRKPTFIISLTSQLIAFLFFLNADTMLMLYLGSAAFGLFYGSFATLFPALIGDLFGRAHSGAIGGVIFGAGGFLGGWGPAIAGYLRDTHGDFGLAFKACIVTTLCSVLLVGFLQKPRQGNA